MLILRAFKTKRWVEDKKIEMIKNWLEPKWMRDIQTLLDYANFYQRFIYGSIKLARLLT